MTRRIFHIFPLLLLVAVAIWSLSGRLMVWSDPTSANQWREAAREAVTHVTEGDALLVHPFWSEAPLPYLRGVEEKLLFPDTLLREDLQGRRRLIIVSEVDRITTLPARLPFQASPHFLSSHGDVAVYVVDVPPTMQWGEDVVASLSDAIVKTKGKPCSRFDSTRESWTCPGGARAAMRSQEIEDAPRRCLVLSPPQGSRLEVTFPDLSLSEALRVRFGWSLLAIRSMRHAPTSMRVQIRIGDEEVFAEEVDGRDYSWKLARLATSRWSDRPTDVTFVVSTPDAKRADLCLNAWIIDEK